VFRAFRQALSWASARSLATRDASTGIRNPKTWDDVSAITDELEARYRALPIVGVGCGLRPEELFGLHRTDVDREAGVLHARRRFTDGELKAGTKTGPERAVPLRQRVLSALEAMPPRIDTRSCFRPREAATPTLRSSATASGPRRFAPLASSIGGSTTCGTRSRRGRLRAACRPRISPW
jgi:integrase